MPRPLFRVLIVAFWCAMTGWLFKAEVLPNFGYGDAGFRAMLSDRVIQESTRWRIELDRQRVGSATTVVQPLVDGSFSMQSEIRLDLAKAGGFAATDPSDSPPTVPFQAKSDIRINSLGRLETVGIVLEIVGLPSPIQVTGVVERRELVLQTAGLSGIPLVPDDLRIPIEPDSMLADKFVPWDRIPNLRVGKQWTTRTINPFAAATGPMRWLLATETVEILVNQVTGVEPITWDEQPTLCFVIEHRRREQVSKTWARVTDGRVLKREVAVAGRTMTFHLEFFSE